MGLSELNAKDFFSKNKSLNIPTTLGLVHRIYQCESSLRSPLLAASISQKNNLLFSVKPAAPLLLSSCESAPTSCATLNIKGSISITDSKNVAITVGSLSDITVQGSMFIFIPADGSFTINGTAYTTSPIQGLTIRQNNNNLGVRIFCTDIINTSASGVILDGVTLNVQDDIAISNNVTNGNFGVEISTSNIISTKGNIMIENNQGSSIGFLVYSAGSSFGNFFNLELIRKFQTS